MGGTRIRVFAGVLGMLVVFSGNAVTAEPLLTVASPGEGATISRASGTAVDVAGTALFDEVQRSTRKFFARRAVCGGTADQGIRLELENGPDAGDGCGNLLGVVGGSTTAFPAAAGVPLTLDAGKIAGQVTVSSFQGLPNSPVGAGAGQQSVTMSVTAGDETLVISTQNYLVTPDKPVHVLPFEGEIATELVGRTFEDLTLTVTVASGALLHGFVGTAGKTWFTVPVTNAPRVDVSLDSATFATKTVKATLAGDGSWTARLAMPAVGAHKIYIRAVQDDQTTTGAPVNITVTN